MQEIKIGITEGKDEYGMCTGKKKIPHLLRNPSKKKKTEERNRKKLFLF